MGLHYSSVQTLLELLLLYRSLNEVPRLIKSPVPDRSIHGEREMSKKSGWQPQPCYQKSNLFFFYMPLKKRCGYDCHHLDFLTPLSQLSSCFQTTDKCSYYTYLTFQTIQLHCHHLRSKWFWFLTSSILRLLQFWVRVCSIIYLPVGNHLRKYFSFAGYT